ncbi:MAG: hypothetical protein H6945_12630 [Zoogloeaceae bacterium]|nr:hypothetical protein [Rhodocyclaceae bacterium]MCP5236572.1 hypothetical protein [Zoogloeaceae bacterium]
MADRDDRERTLARLKKLFPGKISQIGEDNLEDILELVEGIDEIRGEISLRAIIGPSGGMVVAAVVLLPVLLTWWLDFPGLVAGVLLSIALIYSGLAVRAVATTASIHPGGAAGCAVARGMTGKHRFGGTLQHQINRMRATYAISRFLFAGGEEDRRRLSWRPFALAFLITIALAVFPVIGIAIVVLVIAIVAHAIVSGRAPIALYLGPSTVAAIKLFWRVRYASGITWASLLKDPLEPKSEVGDSIEERLDMLANQLYSNPWSLRWEGNEAWMDVVRDFAVASAVIVVKAANVPAVRSELALLAASHSRGRIIVVVDDACPVEALPAGLRAAAMAEDRAIELLSLIASDPRAFRARLRDRARLFAADDDGATGASAC